MCQVCELAAEWRQKWKSDVVIDIVCYRKHGHNEIDEPMFTHPLMYKVIKKKKNALILYQNKLISEGIIDKVCGRNLPGIGFKYTMSQGTL